MPTPNPTLRREFKGAAAGTTLQNPMLSTDTTFVLVATNNWPTGSVGKFVVTINRGQADEEKILCDTQSGRTVACLLANRGFDGTTAQGHAANATVECTISAFDADEWNQHTAATTGVHGVAGAVVGTTDAQTLTNKTLTQPAIGDHTLAQHTHEDAPSGGILQPEAWASWTPTIQGTGWALGNATITGQYRQVGRSVHFSLSITWGTTSTFGAGSLTVSTPVSAPGSNVGNIVAAAFHSGNRYGLDAFSPAGGAGIGVYQRGATGQQTPVSSTVPFTWASGDQLTLAGSFQASTSAYA